MALRWSLEARFELFWALVAKWLSDGLWRFILNSSEKRLAQAQDKPPRTNPKPFALPRQRLLLACFYVQCGLQGYFYEVKVA